MRTLNKEIQEGMTPQDAVETLKKGNERFVNNSKAERNLLQQVNDTRDGQWPFAAIVSCMDSRTSAELVFDLGIGDVFSIRVAGNVINDDILGSLEYAAKVVGSKLLVVLGHTKCGAVKGACDHVELGHLSNLLSKIEPAIAAEKETQDNRSASNSGFVENVSRLNVRNGVNEILQRSSIIRGLVEEGKVGLIGAMYDVNTGQVEFYQDTFVSGAQVNAGQPKTEKV